MDFQLALIFSLKVLFVITQLILSWQQSEVNEMMIWPPLHPQVYIYGFNMYANYNW